jgi:hypothetical protein
MLRDDEEAQATARVWPDQKQPSRESIQKKRSRQWARLVDSELGGTSTTSPHRERPLTAEAWGLTLTGSRNGQPR